MDKNKATMIFGSIFLLTVALAQIGPQGFSQGEVITQEEYDAINFSKDFFNISFIQSRGNVKAQCGRNGCKIPIEYYVLEREFVNQTWKEVHDDSSTTTFIRGVPTGNYTYLRKTDEIIIPSYVYAARGSSVLKPLLLEKRGSLAERYLRKHVLKKTSQNQEVNLGSFSK